MNHQAGHLHVIAGPMFAGKTEELIRRLNRVRLAGRTLRVLSHSFDTRGGTDRLHTHTGASIRAEMAADAGQLAALLRLGPGAGPAADVLPDVVAIDEAQFFGPGLRAVVDELLRRGVDVEIAGLCVTFDGEPFAPLPGLMAQADRVTKLTAICTICGADAPFHIRRAPQQAHDALTASAEHVGGTESYEARCRSHLRAG